MPADYAALQRLGVDVKGKIVIARYGGGWRGLKPKLAHEHGAIGCIIYSDPADDGYATADPYPKGPARPERGIQRGSVMDVQTLESGDPLTPGYGSVAGEGRQAHRPLGRSQDDPQDTGDPDLLGRRCPFPRAHGRSGRAEELARSPADHLPRGRRGGRARGPSGRPVQLEPGHDLRRHRHDAGRASSRRMGGPRQSPRRLGVRRGRSAVGPDRDDAGGQGDRGSGEDRLAPGPDDRLRQLGR